MFFPHSELFFVFLFSLFSFNSSIYSSSTELSRNETPLLQKTTSRLNKLLLGNLRTNRERVIFPYSRSKNKKKNTFFIDQSAFSNFALYVIRPLEMWSTNLIFRRFHVITWSHGNSPWSAILIRKLNSTSFTSWYPFVSSFFDTRCRPFYVCILFLGLRYWRSVMVEICITFQNPLKSLQVNGWNIWVQN